MTATKMAPIQPADAAVRQKVIDWIDAHSEEIIYFLQELIKVPSVNPWFLDQEGPSYEKEVQDLIAGRLKKLGAQVEQWEPDVQALAAYRGRPGYYPDHVFIGRPNQVALFKGTGGGRSILLTGHVDVVKAASGWKVEPFGAQRQAGFVFGRGAVDMKGGIASMVMAVEALQRSGVKMAGDILVGTVVDEEAGGMGTLDFVSRGYRADACFMTEPTNLKIAPICRGILWGKLILKGRSGHIELPQPHWKQGGAVDAIQLARLYLDQFERLNQDWGRRKRHPLLPEPCQLFVAQMNAGEYPTAFANRAELVFNAQYLPEERDEFGLGGKVKEEIEAFVSAVAMTDPWLKDNLPEIEWLIDADCAETPGDHEFVQCCARNIEELGLRAEIEGLGCHTDMGWFVNVGIPTINFGAGNISVAHQNDESISEADLVKATKIIASTIFDWCGVAG
jgi:acetylornithine deacetylase